MKKIIVLFAAVTLVLSGCSVFAPKKETVCSFEDTDFMDSKIISVSKGDKVLTDELTSSFDMETYDSLGYSKKDVEEELKKDEETYDIEGVTYSYKVTDEKASFKILIDYKKIDFDDAKELGIIGEKSDDDASYIDLKKTIESREELGMTCKTE